MRVPPVRACAFPVVLALFAAAPADAAGGDAQAIAGTWIGEAFSDHVHTVDGREPPLTTEGAALYRANLADRKSAQPQFDRTRWCAGPGMPRIMFMPTPFEVIVFGKNLANVVQSLLSMVLGYVIAAFAFGYSLNAERNWSISLRFSRGAVSFNCTNTCA